MIPEPPAADAVATPGKGPAPLEPAGPRRASAAFMVGHPAHWIAFGFGSGLAPWAPGTVGTLWAWVAFVVFDRWLSDAAWAVLILVSWGVGWGACTVTARHLRSADPSAIVWDEVVAFWLVLWMVTPAGLWAQAVAFALFRYFDAAKPGPVGWADRRFKAKGTAIGAAQGFGILLDDLIAAACTLWVIAAWRFVAG